MDKYATEQNIFMAEKKINSFLAPKWLSLVQVTLCKLKSDLYAKK